MRRAFLRVDQSINPDYKVSGKDYYQIFTSILMLILGGIVLIRSLSGPFFILPLLIGTGLVGLGGYRLNFVIKFFRVRKNRR